MFGKRAVSRTSLNTSLISCGDRRSKSSSTTRIRLSWAAKAFSTRSRAAVRPPVRPRPKSSLASRTRTVPARPVAGDPARSAAKCTASSSVPPYASRPSAIIRREFRRSRSASLRNWSDNSEKNRLTSCSASLNSHGLKSSTSTPPSRNVGLARLMNEVLPEPHAPNTATTSPPLASIPSAFFANARASFVRSNRSSVQSAIGLSARLSRVGSAMLRLGASSTHNQSLAQVQLPELRRAIARVRASRRQLVRVTRTASH